MTTISKSSTTSQQIALNSTSAPPETKTNEEKVIPPGDTFENTRSISTSSMSVQSALSVGCTSSSALSQAATALEKAGVQGLNYGYAAFADLKLGGLTEIEQGSRAMRNHTLELSTAIQSGVPFGAGAQKAIDEMGVALEKMGEGIANLKNVSPEYKATLEKNFAALQEAHAALESAASSQDQAKLTESLKQFSSAYEGVYTLLGAELTQAAKPNADWLTSQALATTDTWLNNHIGHLEELGYSDGAIKGTQDLADAVANFKATPSPENREKLEKAADAFAIAMSSSDLMPTASAMVASLKNVLNLGSGATDAQISDAIRTFNNDTRQVLSVLQSKMQKKNLSENGDQIQEKAATLNQSLQQLALERAGDSESDSDELDALIRSANVLTASLSRNTNMVNADETLRKLSALFALANTNSGSDPTFYHAVDSLIDTGDAATDTILDKLGDNPFSGML